MSDLRNRAPHPDLPPPASTVGLIGWLRRNLFSSPLNAALTLLALYLLWIAIPPLLNWTLFNAHWSGDSRAACPDDEGACWVFIRVHFGQFMYGFYPDDQRWRVNLALIWAPRRSLSAPRQAGSKRESGWVYW
jgi:general L-amino acid transport system permease protein